MATAEISSMASHMDFVSAGVGILLTIIGYFAVRTLQKIDKNQGLLFEQVSLLWKELWHLKGQHEARTCNHNNKKDD